MSIFHRGQHKDPFTGPAPVPPDITQPHTRPGITLLQAPEAIPFPPRPAPAPPRAVPAPVPAPVPSSPMAIVTVAYLTAEVLHLQGQDLLHLLDGETPRVSNDGTVLPPEDSTLKVILQKAADLLRRCPPSALPRPLEAAHEGHGAR